MDTRHRHVCLHEAPTLLSRAYHNDSVFHSHNIFPTVVLCIKIVALISETDPSSPLHLSTLGSLECLEKPKMV